MRPEINRGCHYMGAAHLVFEMVCPWVLDLTRLDRGWYVPHVSWVLVWPATRVPCGQTLPGVRANYQRSACVRAGVRARVCERASERARGGGAANCFTLSILH